MPAKGITTPSDDPLRRTVRGAIQVGIVQIVLNVYQAFAPHPLTIEQYGVLTVAGTAAFTLLMNYLEDNTPLPAVFKAPPSTGENPVP
jgi:hypothetical protein